MNFIVVAYTIKLDCSIEILQEISFFRLCYVELRKVLQKTECHTPSQWKDIGRFGFLFVKFFSKLVIFNERIFISQHQERQLYHLNEYRLLVQMFRFQLSHLDIFCLAFHILVEPTPDCFHGLRRFVNHDHFPDDVLR